jgi:hypothetical protein
MGRIVPGTIELFCARNKTVLLCLSQVISKKSRGFKKFVECSFYSNKKIERKIQWEDNLEFGILVQFIILLPEGIEKIMFLGTARITTITYHFY